MIVDVRDWLERVWPSVMNRQAVMRDYASVGQLRHFLADVALRGSVWGPCHVPGDDRTSAVNEGRRQLALEILKLAGEEPTRLFTLIERSPASQTRAR